MTDDRVPDEWVEAAAKAIYWGGSMEAHGFVGWMNETDTGPVGVAKGLWPLVAAERDRAVKDALAGAVERLEALLPSMAEAMIPSHLIRAVVADLRDGAR